MLTSRYQMTNSTFSQWLLSELESREWSQVDLSRKSGVSQAQITRVLSGERGIGEKALSAIASALKLPPEHVFRMAGLLPPKENADEWVEEMNHKMGLLNPAKRPMAERLLNALLEEDKPVIVHKKARAKT